MCDPLPSKVWCESMSSARAERGEDRGDIGRAPDHAGRLVAPGAEKEPPAREIRRRGREGFGAANDLAVVPPERGTAGHIGRKKARAGQEGVERKITAERMPDEGGPLRVGR